VHRCWQRLSCLNDLLWDKLAGIAAVNLFMSAGSRLFLKRIRSVDFGIEPSTCSMQPNPSCSGRTPEYTARIRSTQSVPCRQHEQLSVAFGEGPKAREGDEAVFVGGFLGLINHR
jgi:hypothetical protein